VARVVVLDSGPLGDACRKRGKPDVESLTQWWIHAKANGVIIAIPEIADYEVRRGLLLTGANEGIKRLEQLREDLGHYIPISTSAMRRAAELWADARKHGHATADEREIDADVILAAQVMLFSGARDNVIIATYNTKHLSRYFLARSWREITP
jgi:predicted nucleic acid-binding protein